MKQRHIAPFTINVTHPTAGSDAMPRSHDSLPVAVDRARKLSLRNPDATYHVMNSLGERMCGTDDIIASPMFNPQCLEVFIEHQGRCMVHYCDQIMPQREGTFLLNVSRDHTHSCWSCKVPADSVTMVTPIDREDADVRVANSAMLGDLYVREVLLKHHLPNNHPQRYNRMAGELPQT